MPGWPQYREWLKLPPEDRPAAFERSPPALADFSTDSRSISPGQWFIPLVGERFDGHRFIGDVMAAGAAGFLYDRKAAAMVPAACLDAGIPVGDTGEALRNIAAGWRGALPDLRLMALTGSTGKTTVKEMLSAVVARAAPSLVTSGSFNNEIGVPLTLLQLREEHRYGVLEFGARHSGDIRLLCRMADPDIRAVLNAGSAHIGEFGSLALLRRTKLEMLTTPRDDGSMDFTGIVCGDDPHLLEGARAGGSRLLTFGLSPGNDIRVIGSEGSATGGQTIHLATPRGDLRFTLPAFHISHPINTAAAAAMALAAGLGPTDIRNGLESFQGVKGRFRIHQLSGRTLIDDAYNANPASMEAGLQTLIRAWSGRRKALILGDMKELGEESRARHEDLGRLCATVPGVNRLILVGEECQVAAAAARAAGFPAEHIHQMADVQEVLENIDIMVENSDLIYVKGSNSIGLEQVVATLIEA